MQFPILEPGAYQLPNDCKAIVRAGVVCVSKKSVSNLGLNRCRMCAHYAVNPYSRYTTTYICKMKPKGYNRENKITYYSAQGSDKACDKFQSK